MLIERYVFRRLGSSFSRTFKRGKNEQLKETEKRDLEQKNLHMYVKAKCCKMTGRNQEAQTLYLEHLENYKVLTYEDVFTTIFGIMMLPSMESRRKIADTLESLVDHLNLYGDARTLNGRPLMNVYFSAEEDAWNFESELIAAELRKKSFFCRFDTETLA